MTPWIVACTKLLHPWDFQGKSTGVGCHFLLQGISPTQGLNPGLSHCRQTLYRLSHQRSPSNEKERLKFPVSHQWGSMVAQLVKNPPTMWETWVPSLDWEDPLEKWKATHSSILAWRILWGGKESDKTERPSLSLSHQSLFFSGKIQTHYYVPIT